MRPNHTLGCVIFAPRSTLTAPFTRSSTKLSVPLDLPTRIQRRRNSISSTHCSRENLTPRQDAAQFAEMLSLPNEGRYPTVELTPQQKRQKTLEAQISQLAALSRENPVLMIFEDIHWIDPTTLEALGKTVDRMRALPVLLIVTHRPEFQPPWIGRSYVAALNINRLGEREIIALIDCVTGNNSLPRVSGRTLSSALTEFHCLLRK